MTKRSLLFIIFLTLSTVAGATVKGNSGDKLEQTQNSSLHSSTTVGVGVGVKTNVNSDANAKSTSRSNSKSNSVAKGGDATSVGIGVGGDSNASAVANGGRGGKGGNASVGNTTSTASNNIGNVTSNSGDSLSKSNANVGDTSATIGDVTTGASTSSAVSTNEGNTVASENNNTVNDGDVTIDAGSSYESNFEAAASSAASVFAGYCQSGGSGQLTGGGFSVVNSEQFCDHVRLASIMREAYEYEVAMGKGEEEYATKYYEAYHDNLGDALRLIEGSEFAGMIDRNTGFIIRPAALVGLLIFLL